MGRGRWAEDRMRLSSQDEAALGAPPFQTPCLLVGNTGAPRPRPTTPECCPPTPAARRPPRACPVRARRPPWSPSPVPRSPSWPSSRRRGPPRAPQVRRGQAWRGGGGGGWRLREKEPERLRLLGAWSLACGVQEQSGGLSPETLTAVGVRNQPTRRSWCDAVWVPEPYPDSGGALRPELPSPLAPAGGRGGRG